MVPKDPTLDNEARYDRMASSYATITRLLSFCLISRLRGAAAGALDLPTGATLPDCGRCVENALAVLKPRGQLVVVDSILLPGHPVANFVIRRKAPALGGYPDDLPLSLLVDRLDGVQTRRLLGGVYMLVTGRKPARAGPSSPRLGIEE